MKSIRNLITLAALFVLFVGVSFGQYNTLSTTRLTNAVAASDVNWTVTSTSGFVAPTMGQNGTTLYVDGETAYVSTIINSTVVTVRRMQNAVGHGANQLIYYGLPNLFYTSDAFGSCTSATVFVSPWLNVSNGHLFQCQNSQWTLQEIITNINSPTDANPVRINSRDYVQTTGTAIGFQVKPAQTVANTTDGIIGGEISPRVNSGIAIAHDVIGLHVDAWLKGTAAGTIGRDVRGLNIELYTDDAGTRTISGDVSLIRLRSAFSATTITGKFVPIRVERAETQTNSKNFDALLELTGTSPLVWNNDPATEVTGSIKGYIGVLVNGVKRYIALYDTPPVD